MRKTSWQSSSRTRARRVIINTTMLVILTTIPTFTHASPTDGCRGTCDRFRDRFCEEWIGTCEECRISTENAKCVSYFKTMEAANNESQLSPSKGRGPSREATSTVTSSSAQPIRPSSDELTIELNIEDDPNLAHSSDQLLPSANIAKQDPSQDQGESNTQSKSPARPKYSETRPKSQEVLADRDSDGAAVSVEESSDSPFILKISVALSGVLIVMVIGGFVMRRRQRNSRLLTAQNVEGQQQATEEEREELNPTQASQEEGAAGGTVALPNMDFFAQNEAHGHDDIVETEL